jgi:hypothetical protein
MKHFLSHAETRRFCALGKAEDVAIEIAERDREIERMREMVFHFNAMPEEKAFIKEVTDKYIQSLAPEEKR